ncbi:BTAD domain-containing putative transcriptional regulator [Streptomyces sp. NBC_01408]|uniref:AfsR/SARP family transcriptional regulator n=1 Tax=Streptomyces sp. NBC_01408 TaxID=2903855 RepID=UPI0022557EF9|nr:BTAD domain-containing putative transcriptional regulator [Streptomyces sp. NBC_01408]MCX4696576.1 tetratricopeptide repeat protein [Streptomyces sp. NBC_01408]
MGESLEGQVCFNVLGPLEGWNAGVRIRLGGQIHERVLATLLLESRSVVPVARLVEAVWDEEPPVTASHQIRKAVAELRRRIPEGGKLIVTDGPGYRAEVGDGRLDLLEFSRHLREARISAAAGRTREAVDHLRAALALWRGPVMSGTGGSVVEAAGALLEERRLGAAEQLFNLRLALGEAGELVGDLRTLIAQHPLRETLRGQLMLALYRSGRQAEALTEYAKVRELLVEELGIDPSAQLTKMYEDILRASPELASPAALPAAGPGAEALAAPTPAPESAAAEAGAPGVPRVPVPAVPAAGAAPPAPRGASPSTLPPDLADFTGRERELAEVLEACGRDTNGGPRIVAVDGMGGCGKTVLAVRAAYQLADQYPEGQLYADLRGFSPGEQPQRPAVTLGGMLRVLGVPPEGIPDDEAALVGLWRATVAGRRLLFLFDNAFDAGQVLPLLPPSADCLVLVTSRSRVCELDGAAWISLGVMPPQESQVMLAELLGDDRVAREPEAAGELAVLCGHLPLALRLAGARLRNRPRWTLRYLTERLEDETRRLDELSAGERSVAATLSLSYKAMEESLQEAFCLLGLHPGAEVDVYSAAALLETGVRDAEDMLEDLLDMHLLVQKEPGLYTFHDLVRTYALSLGEGPEGKVGRASDGRLLGYYTGATEAACVVLFPSRRSMKLPPCPEYALPPVKREDRALKWFDQESAGIQTLLARAGHEGSPQQVFALARNASFHLNFRGRFTEFEAVCRSGLAATRSMGDSQLVCRMLNNLGVARWKLGRFAEAAEASEEALEWARHAGAEEDVAVSLGILGLVHYGLGNLTRSYAYLMESVKALDKLGPNMLQQLLEDLNTFATVCTALGRHEEAADAARRVISLCQEFQSPDQEAIARMGLALTQCAMGDLKEARASLDRALALSGCCTTETVVLMLAVSADVWDLLGETEPAREHGARALEVMTSTTSPQRRSRMDNVLALAHRRHGRHEEALRTHERALRCAEGSEYRVEMAHALDGMAAAAEELGLPEAAGYRDRAETLFEAMGVPPNGRRIV